MLHVEVFSPICMVDFFLLVVFPKGFLHKEMWVYGICKPDCGEYVCCWCWYMCKVYHVLLLKVGVHR